MNERNGRRYDRRYAGVHRLTTLRQCLLMCAVASSFNDWFTRKEFIHLFREEVGSLSDRTAHRYLVALEMAGLLERKALNRKEHTFKWLGWPEPFHA